LYGNGDRKWITLNQTATGNNDANIMQDGGKQTEMTISQTATAGNNYAQTAQHGSAFDSRTDVSQCGSDNSLTILEELGGGGDYTWIGLD